MQTHVISFVVNDDEYMQLMRSKGQSKEWKNFFMELVKSNFDIVMKIFKTLSNRVRTLNRKVEILTFMDVQVRFADVMLELIDKYGVKIKDGILIDISLYPCHYN